jgi:hypothetical protein
MSECSLYERVRLMLAFATLVSRTDVETTFAEMTTDGSRQTAFYPAQHRTLQDKLDSGWLH